VRKEKVMRALTWSAHSFFIRGGFVLSSEVGRQRRCGGNEMGRAVR
jgi:hypothetical protein